MKKILTLMLLIAICLTSTVLVSCNSNGTPSYDVTTDPNATPEVEDNEAEPDQVPAEGVWANATYRSDKTFGSGEKTVRVEVKADGYSVVFTIKTNAATLADALIENNLVEGDNDQFGLYIKRVNGILADYNIDQTWWGVEQNGAPLNFGASQINISDGDSYELVRSK